MHIWVQIITLGFFDQSWWPARESVAREGTRQVWSERQSASAHIFRVVTVKAAKDKMKKEKENTK